ncbi:MAG: hypothetical protein OWS74_03145, partial [Firmicutes bacterium]|nr:hypothetical protein [Bacillota bacterium]
VPADAGTLSAQGLARSQAFADYLRSVLLPLAQLSDAMLAEHFAWLRKETGRQLMAEGYEASDIVYEESLDLRYQGEAYEIMTLWQGTRDSTAAYFHQLHDQYYLHADHHTPIECVNVYVKAMVKERKITLPKWQEIGSNQPFDWRSVVFLGEEIKTPCYHRTDLSKDQEIKGPALVFDPSSTTLVPPASRAVLDALGVLHIHLS